MTITRPSPDREYAMLHSLWQSRMPSVGAELGSGVVWLADHATVSFTGPDARQFLQGYLTSDASKLHADPAPTAICSRQGRVVVNGLAWFAEPTVTLLVHASLTEKVLEFLKPYLAFSRTRAANHTQERLVFGLIDALPSADALRIDARRQLLITDSIERAEEIWRNAAPARHSDAWTAIDVDRLWPWVSAATSDAFLPQMLNLAETAISFEKGCYLGQEIVARAQHRGQVKRTLAALSWRGTVPSAGDELVASQRSRGTVITATSLPGAGSALAVLATGATEDLRGPAGTTFLRRADPV